MSLKLYSVLRFNMYECGKLASGSFYVVRTKRKELNRTLITTWLFLVIY